MLDYIGAEEGIGGSDRKGGELIDDSDEITNIIGQENKSVKIINPERWMGVSNRAIDVLTIHTDNIGHCKPEERIISTDFGFLSVQSEI